MDLEKKFGRLARLVGTDEGFYILALHAFVEYWLRYEQGYGEGPPFHELTWTFRRELLERHHHAFIDGLYCLAGLGHQHVLTNRVRHAFERMDPEEAAAATHLFLTFCRLAGIEGCPAGRELEKALELWKERIAGPERAGEVRRMQEELRRLQCRGPDLVRRRPEYERLKGELNVLQVQIAAHDGRASHAAPDGPERMGAERLEALQRERNSLVEERRRLQAELERHRDLERYLQYLGRLSICCRTRAEYEQSIGRLTPEQEQAVAGMSLKNDSLLKGGPGTGKSLVLIEALRRALLERELDFGQDESVVLVTYTRTLARYNRYVAEIRGLDLPVRVISTLDTLFYEKLRQVEPDMRYDFELLERHFGPERTPPFLTPEELAGEVEHFLFAGALSEAEYVEGAVPRQGMRRRLSRGQRRVVWGLREEFARGMEESRVYTTHFGRLKLLEHLRARPGDPSLRGISTLFLDEVQDLTPAALMILRAMTRGAMVMAGDADQSLYRFQWPFARAGVRLQGVTRVLKTNFRNTGQIQALAERFRGCFPAESWATATRPATFREGPVPELYTAGGPQELKDLLARKLAIFTADLGYEPQNVCILVPRNVEARGVADHLARAGVESADIGEERFTFREPGKVCLSTLHSSKGLDFPVVLLYLPYLHRRGQYAGEQEEQLLRNLVYVGLTRAMDHLNVFTVESDDPLLLALTGCFVPPRE